MSQLRTMLGLQPVAPFSGNTALIQQSGGAQEAMGADALPASTLSIMVEARVVSDKQLNIHYVGPDARAWVQLIMPYSIRYRAECWKNEKTHERLRIWLLGLHEA